MIWQPLVELKNKVTCLKKLHKLNFVSQRFHVKCDRNIIKFLHSVKLTMNNYSHGVLDVVVFDHLILSLATQLQTIMCRLCDIIKHTNALLIFD